MKLSEKIENVCNLYALSFEVNEEKSDSFFRVMVVKKIKQIIEYDVLNV